MLVDNANIQPNRECQRQTFMTTNGSYGWWDGSLLWTNGVAIWPTVTTVWRKKFGLLVEIPTPITIILSYNLTRLEIFLLKYIHDFRLKLQTKHRFRTTSKTGLVRHWKTDSHAQKDGQITFALLLKTWWLSCWSLENRPPRHRHRRHHCSVPICLSVPALHEGASDVHRWRASATMQRDRRRCRRLVLPAAVSSSARRFVACW